ncbi:putative metalloprotease [Candidatus Fokinia solitaria]|uniref:Putative metalloprotease n=1 Tax=Candidatus Fokinia solitaria TaxID=1802984 RepID=A0A2U8BT23_9RICK|nr:M23 family metallopeptidase [Candidatus Fokinia solitaria]AWD33458.1 putative metalloprotease [Candidatus Fokinia solitaria]
MLKTNHGNSAFYGILLSVTLAICVSIALMCEQVNTADRAVQQPSHVNTELQSVSTRVNLYKLGDDRHLANIFQTLGISHDSSQKLENDIFKKYKKTKFKINSSILVQQHDYDNSGTKLLEVKNGKDQICAMFNEKQQIHVVKHFKNVKATCKLHKDFLLHEFSKVAKKRRLPKESSIFLVNCKLDGKLPFSQNLKKSGLSDKVVYHCNSLIKNIGCTKKLQGDFKVAYSYANNGSPTILYISLQKHLNKPPIEAFFYKTSTQSGYFFKNGALINKSSQARSTFISPVKGKITSSYGRRKHPIFGTYRMHRGVDYGAPRGTLVVASNHGTIAECSYNSGLGRYVRIQHDNGYSTVYAHLSQFSSGIAVGKKVSQKQVIGYVGSTGTSTGSHLHFEVRKGRTAMNPQLVCGSATHGIAKQTKNILTADFKLHMHNIKKLFSAQQMPHIQTALISLPYTFW